MKSISTETKVGIFVVVGILILAYFTAKVGKIEIREKAYHVNAYVDSAAGLDKNSQVRIAGVEVGKVESISLEGLKAKVILRIPNRIQIPEGSKFFVKSSGLLGEKYVEIAPGPGPLYIKANGIIEEGGPSVDVDRVLTQLSSIGGDIQSVTRSLSRVLGGPEGEENIKELVTGAKETMVNLQNITQSIDRGEGTLGKLVKDDKLYAEVKDTMTNLRDMTQTIEEGKGTLGKLVKDEALYAETKATMIEAKETLANLNKVTKQIESGEGTLGKLVKDDTLYVKTAETMEGAKQTMANLNKVSLQIESGEGTLGKLVKDETLYDDTRRAVNSVQKAAEGINEATPVTVLGLLLGLVIR